MDETDKIDNIALQFTATHCQKASLVFWPPFKAHWIGFPSILRAIRQGLWKPFLWQPTHGTRARGRPKMSLVDLLMKDAGGCKHSGVGQLHGRQRRLEEALPSPTRLESPDGMGMGTQFTHGHTIH